MMFFEKPLSKEEIAEFRKPSTRMSDERFKEIEARVRSRRNTHEEEIALVDELRAEREANEKLRESLDAAKRQIDDLIRPIIIDAEQAIKVEKLSAENAELLRDKAQLEDSFARAVDAKAAAQIEVEQLRQQLAAAEQARDRFDAEAKHLGEGILHYREQLAAKDADSLAYHRVMSLLRNTKLNHGVCVPRSRRACTRCNANDDLNALIEAYKGAPIKLMGEALGRGQ